VAGYHKGNTSFFVLCLSDYIAMGLGRFEL
jgi:hypothetical protein